MYRASQLLSIRDHGVGGVQASENLHVYSIRGSENGQGASLPDKLTFAQLPAVLCCQVTQAIPDRWDQETSKRKDSMLPTDTSWRMIKPRKGVQRKRAVLAHTQFAVDFHLSPRSPSHHHSALMIHSVTHGDTRWLLYCFKDCYTFSKPPATPSGGSARHQRRHLRC